MTKYIIKGKEYNNQGEYRKELIKRKGYDYVDIDKQLEIFVKTKGFKDYKELLDIIAMGRGFTCYREYYNSWKYYPGMINPLYENRSNQGFIGYIAEIGMIKVCTNSQAMKHGNPGYDFICNKGYKIDVKGSMLYNNRFSFKIRKNKIADYFILVAFNNDIININPLYIWLIKNSEIIKEYSINDYVNITFSNVTDIDHLRKYEMIKELRELKKICIGYNKNHAIDRYYIIKNILATRFTRLDFIDSDGFISKIRPSLHLIPEEEVLY